MTTESLTLNEFKMWLAGVEEMQSDDWTPSEAQWKKIRAKINVIVENRPLMEVSHTLPPAFHQPDSYGDPSTNGLAPIQPAFTSFTIDNVATPAASQQSQIIGPASAVNTGVPRTKTPDIDTSGGNYVTTFV